MGKNAAFGRPGVPDRLLSWWRDQSRTTRQNVALFAVIAVVVIGLVAAATSRDHKGSGPTGLSTLAQPGSVPANLFVPTSSTTSTVVAPDSSSSSTSTSTTARTSTTTSTKAPTPATTAATSATTSVTTSTTPPDPGVIYSPAPTPPAAGPPSTLAAPPTTTLTSPSTTTTTSAPAGAALPLGLPLLSPGGL
jgi:hypothetical protein